MHARHAHDPTAGLLVLANLHQQALVVGLAKAWGPLVPGMKATGRHLQASAHQLDTIETATALDRLIFQRDSFAKNAAASRKKSLSFFTRANSRLSVAISWSRGTPEPGKAFALVVSNSRRQRPRIPAPTPMSRAIWLMLAPGWRVRPTASRLNSSLSFLRLDMTLLFDHHRSSWKCPC